MENERRILSRKFTGSANQAGTRKQTYNEIYHLYGEISEAAGIEPTLVITEDTNSGYEFFQGFSNPKT